MKTSFHSKNTDALIQSSRFNQHRSKIRLLISIGIIFFIVTGMVFFIPYYMSRNILTVAFYGIPDTTQLALEKTITSLSKTETDGKVNKTPFNFTALDDSIPLAEQITKKIDVVFTLAGKNAQSILDNAISINPGIYNNFPYSIGQTGISPDGDPQSVPLLLDHFEVAYNIKLLQQFNGGSPVRSIEQLRGFANFVRTTIPNAGYPISIAGGNDDALLAFVTALIESYYGAEGYNQLVNILNTEQIQSQEDFDRFANEALIESVVPNQAQSLSDVLAQIVQWQTEQLLHPNWLSITTEDLIAFIELQKPAIIFMSLSFHRSVPLREIRQYTSSWFPSGATVTSRSLVFPTVLGIALSEKTIQSEPNTEKTLNAIGVLTTLASENTQSILSEDAELATVHSTAQALDKQASDVRLWAASSESLLPSIAQSAFETPAQIAVFSEYLRNWFKTHTFL